MAKQSIDVAEQSRSLISDIRQGIFKPLYLLMGEEAFYPDLVCKEIIDNCIDESSKDFNEIICYGADTNADAVIGAARQFPMMSDRVLVVVKEAQMMKNLENLSLYCENPLDSTVLVLLMHGGGADKRKALYKSISKNGVVLDSPLVRDYELPRWIDNYYKSLGLELEMGASNLLAEYIGSNLCAIAIETDKLLKNLDEGCKRVSISDIEKNVGISREFSVFELTKALCYKQSQRALQIAAHLSSGARFALPPTISVIFATFNRILRYEAALLRAKGPLNPTQKAAALNGVNPYFYKDYEAAVRNYPLPQTMRIINLLTEFDYLSKGGDGVESSPGELFVELVAKILL